jgi:hypothetical protein
MDFDKKMKLMLDRANALRAKKDGATEEATKTALVQSMLSALGYDIMDPGEVYPEFTADIGTKKGEKVDYAICRNDEPRIFIECKSLNDKLTSDHENQLRRYFNAVTAVKVAILTNGLIYRFFSDFDQPNIMDKKPFFEFNIEKYTSEGLETLKQFSKSDLDIDKFIPTAKNLYVLQNLISVITAEMESPSEELVKILGSRIYNGRMTKGILQEYTTLVKKAYKQIIDDRINSLLNVAREKIEASQQENVVIEGPEEKIEESVVTEDEEIGYYIIRAICAKVVHISRIHIRDSKTYCAVLFDNNNRKPIARMYFNNPNKKYLVWFNEEWKEQREPISEVHDIYQWQEQIRATVQLYLSECRTKKLREKKSNEPSTPA